MLLAFIPVADDPLGYFLLLILLSSGAAALGFEVFKRFKRFFK